jgi:hypothetical protein
MVKPNMLKPKQPTIGPHRPPPAVRRPSIAEAEAQSTALFIAQTTAELARLAQSAGFALLTYLLDVARLEAELHCLGPESAELPSGGMKLQG